jgi:hypothetical protein
MVPSCLPPKSIIKITTIYFGLQQSGYPGRALFFAVWVEVVILMVYISGWTSIDFIGQQQETIATQLYSSILPGKPVYLPPIGDIFVS